jgi:hypothetical protein
MSAFHTDILSCARGVKRTLIERFAAERTKARNRLGNGPRAVAPPLAVPALASGGAVVVGFQIINARTSFSLRTLPNFFSVLRSVGQNLFVYCVTFFCRLILIISFIFSRFFAPKKPALLEHRYNELEVLLRVRADERRGQGFERQPFNLSVVIDRSGSMSGRPLKEAVRRAYQFDSWLSGGGPGVAQALGSEVTADVSGVAESEQLEGGGRRSDVD